jgi:hypothetical protein
VPANITANNISLYANVCLQLVVRHNTLVGNDRSMDSVDIVWQRYTVHGSAQNMQRNTQCHRVSATSKIVSM